MPCGEHEGRDRLSIHDHVEVAEKSVSVRAVTVARVNDSARNAIIAAQRAWALRSSIEFNEHLRTLVVEDNLFQPLSEATQAEVETGAGDELGSDGVPGKLASLYSSSALVCNMFDFWRGRDARPLFAALRLKAGGSVIGFEAKHPTGLRGTPPHLDVELVDGDGVPVAVESKFTEPYGTVHNEFRPAYLERVSLWDGMPKLRAFAEECAGGTVEFQHLHAAQLVKHALGLSHSYGPDGFTLMYLWYFVDGPEGERHRAEVKQFGEMLEGEIRFATRTYQTILDTVAVDADSEAWRRYLTERYVDSMEQFPAGAVDVGRRDD